MDQTKGWRKKNSLRLRYACVDYGGGGGLPGSGSARPGHSNNNNQHKSVITITYTNTSLDDDVCVCVLRRRLITFQSTERRRVRIYRIIIVILYSRALLCALASWRWLISHSLVRRPWWCNGQPCVLNIIIILCRYFGRKCAVSQQNKLNQNWTLLGT